MIRRAPFIHVVGLSGLDLLDSLGFIGWGWTYGVGMDCLDGVDGVGLSASLDRLGLYWVVLIGPDWMDEFVFE